MRSAYAQFMFLTSGADHDQMESMREYMSQLVTGWDAAKVQAIVAETLDTLIDPLVYQEALDLINFHKEQGHNGHRHFNLGKRNGGTNCRSPRC